MSTLDLADKLAQLLTPVVRDFYAMLYRVGVIEIDH